MRRQRDIGLMLRVEYGHAMAGTISESELLTRYKSGERRFSGVDVVSDGSNALERACLDGVELIDCFLSVSFRGASLKGATVHSNAKTCDFSHADLTDADFRDAALCATTFAGAQMDRARFEGSFFHGYDLSAGEVPSW